MSYAKDYLAYLFGNKRFQNPNFPKEIPWGSLTFEETLMFHSLSNSLDSYLLKTLIFESITPQNAYQLFKFFGLIESVEFKNKLMAKYSKEFVFFDELINQNSIPLSENLIIEFIKKDWDRPTLIALLHPDRKRKGKLILKRQNGSYFKIDVLGMSSRGLDYYFSNGQTPQGIYRVDGVMPKNDKFYEFGKYRRLILNFEMEENLRNEVGNQFLESNWWKEAILAFKLGRSHLRIHGSGRLNLNPFSRFFPIVPTSGCLSVSEGYGLHHQRKLLDELMYACNLDAAYENENKINARLIVIETRNVLSITNILN